RLQQVEGPVVYLKATTRYGDDGVRYAATTYDDDARVRDCLADCECVEIDSGHDIHVERPDVFSEAVGRVV
ncbi:MAG: alpha/beta hydrolase, partial [Eggerthellaceae bacterium]|nr:alpha/beta hydrolase [Eggerthellaceae bacterium]